MIFKFFIVLFVFWVQRLNALEGPIVIQGRHYIINKVIDSGGEGTVYEIQDLQSPLMKYALKVQTISTLDPNDQNNPNYKSAFKEREYNFNFFHNRIKNLPRDLKSLFAFMPIAFDHIIHSPEPEFIDTKTPETKVRSGVILMPLADDNLDAQIKNLNTNRSLSTEQQQLERSRIAIQLYSQIIKELHVLSLNSYSYLDLKPLNVGYSSHNNTYSLLDLNSLFSTLHKEDSHRLFLATPIYEAPEIARSNKYSEISQLYSLAMTLLEVLDSRFLDKKIKFRMFNANDNYYDQAALERLEKSYLNSFANIERDKLAKLFLFIKAATEKDPFIRSQKLNALNFSPEILDIVKKANAKQSRVSKLIESLKEKLNSNPHNNFNSKKTCDGLFH